MISVNNLSYNIDSQKIIEDINFSTARGQVTCLLGPNGAGKTTVLKCMNGIFKKNSGTVIVDNDKLSNLNKKEIASRIAYIPQEHNIVFSYKVLDFTVMGYSPYMNLIQRPSAVQFENAEEKLELLGVAHLKNRHFDTLSGGEKQLVLLARALLQNTDYLLLDEPVSHLDFKNKYFLINQLSQLAEKQNKGIVITLHDPNLARFFSQQVIVIKDGCILKKGKTDQVINIDSLQQIYDVSIDESNSKRFLPIF